jgi:hypothetical protein
MHLTARRALAASMAAACLPAPAAAAYAAGADATAPAATATAPAAGKIKIPEGTEFPLRLEETLNSKTSNEGDRFAVSLDEDVKLPDGTVLRAGYKGVGEIVDAHSNGMLGKSGKLAIRISYLKVGDQRIKLRGQKGSQGAHSTGGQVVTLLLFWPAAPFIKGHDTKITKGSKLSAFADQDIDLEGPVPPPPPEA